MNELLLRSIEMSRQHTISLVEDVEDEHWLKTPRSLNLHPAFVLGHINLFDTYALMSLNEAATPIHPSALNVYGPKAKALVRPELYANKADAIARLRDHLNSYRSALPNIGPVEWARENPYEELRAEFPRLRDLLAYVPCHTSQHNEDLVRWRDPAGYPPKQLRLFRP
jgi:hypothetical protein